VRIPPLKPRIRDGCIVEWRAFDRDIDAYRSFGAEAAQAIKRS
jgi:hypothetical protein